METLLSHHWHELPPEEIARLLSTKIGQGLDEFEVRHRQKHFGPNRLTPPKRQSSLVRFLRQLHSPLIYVLLASAGITIALKDLTDAIIILAIVLINVVIGYIQETQAERAIESLALSLRLNALVLRAGTEQLVDASELVPGDIVRLQAGDRVPADLRLIAARELRVVEAALTGESVPVHKRADIILEEETELSERHNMAYAGTTVSAGTATGIVVATGDRTEVGRISELLTTTIKIKTPLTRRIEAFSRVMLIAILALAGLTFLAGVLRQKPAIDMFLAAVALAVSAIPEGLPVAMTITLAVGVRRMARRHAIIRNLAAVETLGSATVICSDKTGTLTRNEMTVQRIVAGGIDYRVTGIGYAPEGNLEPAPGMNLALQECLRAGVLCNDSNLIFNENRWQITGDPTEAALLVAAYKAGLNPDQLRQELPRLDEIPFDSQHQFMATSHLVSGQQVVYLKGSSEALLPRVRDVLSPDGSSSAFDYEATRALIENLAADGLRVLVFCRCNLSRDSTLDHTRVVRGLTLLGMQAMIDPPRPEAAPAIQACHTAGIRVKMITGDHPLTAQAIARQLGLQEETAVPTVTTCRELTDCPDQEITTLVEQTNVFARVTPHHKLRLVEALQKNAHVVAMTGDGVNDAPALKQADVGIAMGINGTEVAKEAADVVLADDNFASIEAAVEEGRCVFDNLVKFLSWTLPTNVGESLVIMVAIAAGIALPILPVQVLWINTITSVLLGTMLAFEPPESDIMLRPPRQPKAPILDPVLVLRIVLVGGLMAAGAFLLYGWQLNRSNNEALARTVAVNAVVLAEMFYLFNARSLRQALFRVPLSGNRLILVGVGLTLICQLAFTYLPVLNRTLYSAGHDLAAWLACAGLGVVIMVVVEIEKWLRRRRLTVTTQSR